MQVSKIVDNALEDINLYNQDFVSFFQETNNYYINNKDTILFDCYRSTLIFNNWKKGLNSINKKMLDHLFDEIQLDVNSSFHLSAYGLYRTANMHLRSSIELSLQLIFFYDHPVELEQWRNEKFIVKHEKLTTYIKEHPKFYDEDINKSVSLLIDKITKKWKYFSKHIHAESLSYFQTEKVSNKKNSFEIKDFNIWKKDFIETVRLLNELYCLFFSSEQIRFPTNIKDVLNYKKI